jgi:hypothetical protein
LWITLKINLLQVGVDRDWWQVPFHHPIWPNAKGTEAAKFKDSYWLSVDKKNEQLQYDRSYKCASTTCLIANINVTTWPLLQDVSRRRNDQHSASLYIFAKSSSTYRCSLMDLSAHVLEGAEVTFQTLADGTASVANLSPEYQRYAFDDAIVTELGRREFDQ